ncbi:MAG: YceI family protein [Polaribacter sp.]
MKKVFILSFLFTLSFHFLGCKSETKKEEKKVETIKKAAFSLKKSKNNINFTAYKTTEKIPVKGQFKKVNIISGGEGNSIKEAINNTEFAVPVSSLFTKDTSRDFKVKKFFFAVMDQTNLLSGKLVVENDSVGYTTIKMNGVTNKVPFNYTIVENKFSMNATIDIQKWNASAALKSLNEACKDLHKGTDGISKTWNDVALHIVSTF